MVHCVGQKLTFVSFWHIVARLSPTLCNFGTAEAVLAAPLPPPMITTSTTVYSTMNTILHLGSCSVCSLRLSGGRILRVKLCIKSPSPTSAGF